MKQSLELLSVDLETHVCTERVKNKQEKLQLCLLNSFNKHSVMNLSLSPLNLYGRNKSEEFLSADEQNAAESTLFLFNYLKQIALQLFNGLLNAQQSL